MHEGDGPCSVGASISVVIRDEKQSVSVATGNAHRDRRRPRHSRRFNARNGREEIPRISTGGCAISARLTQEPVPSARWPFVVPGAPKVPSALPDLHPSSSRCRAETRTGDRVRRSLAHRESVVVVIADGVTRDTATYDSKTGGRRGMQPVTERGW